MIQNCIYCGESANCLDHVIPRAYLASAKKRTGSEGGFTVPSCKQCNSILGDRIFKNLIERKDYLHKRLVVRLSGYTASAVWDEDELSDVGPALRSTIEISRARTSIARDRVRYSAAPPDPRWVDAEARWRSSYGDGDTPDSFWAVQSGSTRSPQ